MVVRDQEKNCQFFVIIIKEIVSHWKFQGTL